jgi:hypothetical protein
MPRSLTMDCFPPYTFRRRAHVKEQRRNAHAGKLGASASNRMRRAERRILELVDRI